MESFTVIPLNLSQLHSAYPLIRHAAPSVDLRGWCKFARRVADPRCADRRGVMIAQSSRLRHPSGLFCYSKEDDLRYGAVLSVQHFVVLDMFDPEQVVNVLVEALEALGRRLKCAAIRSMLPGDARAVEESLLDAGHSLEGPVFRKQIQLAALS